jgi:NAD(P) transhydrogenase
VDTDDLGGLDCVPREILIAGAGVVGLEYASFLAALGSDVILIDQRPIILDFVDREIAEMLSYDLRRLGVILRLAEKVTSVGIDATGNRVLAQLESPRKW